MPNPNKQELYNWMIGQASGIYFQAYQLAYDVAKRAECAYQFELGLNDSNFIQFGYWDNLKKGLLSGERLFLDLKRMEVAYLEKNKRELEITRHISLVMLDPVALIMLKETGQCYVNLPEAIFDLDYPGHYFRRIKSVSLTIPCVTGPYTGVNCTLTLLKSSIRRDSTLLGGTYARQEDDPRFNDNMNSIQSIATSSAQNDSGLFELNFRDERYLPFEGAGVISTWRLELSGIWQKDDGTLVDFRQFDFNTISDVIFHLKYTARDGGDILKDGARDSTEAIEEIMELSEEKGLFRMFSAKHEFPGEWHQFLHPKETDDKHTLTLDITQKRFPFMFQSRTIKIKQLELFMKLKEGVEYPTDTTEHLMVYVLDPSEGPGTGVDKTLESDMAIMNGIPNALFDYGQNGKDTGSWKLEARSADISKLPADLKVVFGQAPNQYWQLKPDVIDDMIVVCRYSLK
ncbi:MAG: hypothetical protein AYP45_16500 [Candidatus Brocadia carolinensis]|uniref:Tc toxin complex TcA C-terminal TcB-binding domain-containing protein n=1 Tax=Candidatus Brocadia carolinensis TaxID=1004156 RepID=A0A1V4APT4_9BACT|nr:MAG: hypothetical protein AYP45_16500 [Candidatus Brocadia caroliniensis]